MKRATTLVGTAMIALALAGCGTIGRKKKSTPVLGDRVAVLVNETEIEVDPAAAAAPMALPAALDNADWAQAGGNAVKSVGHVALGRDLAPAWTASIGAGTSPKARLGGGPVVMGGKVFTIDTGATVRAFDLASGRELWATRFGAERGNGAALFGGGVAADNGRIYAANGLGHVAALDAATGAIAWTKKPGGPLRGQPTVSGDALYVISQDNQIFSLKTADGSANWSSSAALEIAGISGNGAPAVGSGTVVAGFSSGELNAYRYENGRQLWQDALSRTSVTTSVSALADIDASPVIDQGQVIALGQGGRMVALDLLSGQRRWELNFAGISTPWVAGEWLFAVNDRGQLVAVQRQTGKIRWITQLARWEKPKSKSGPIYYYGPILAGDRLVLAGTNGALINVDPGTGAVQTQTTIGSGVSFQPVVAGKTLLVLGDNGRLLAYR